MEHVSTNFPPQLHVDSTWCACWDILSILDDTGMCQSDLKPTRYENILDLLITNSPILVNRIETIPGLSDHEVIFGGVDISPQKITNNKPSVRVYSK